MRLAFVCPLALVLAAPVIAEAHIQLTYPLPRSTLQKDRHCGSPTRSQNPTVLPPGATFNVTWNETIPHPGHYRISFDTEGEDFTIPLGYDDFTQTENVLVDDITDNEGTGSYSVEITLPDVECETCTLQLIQMMTDKAPYGEVAGEADDIYFQCADIALRSGAPDPEPDPTGPDAGVDDDDDPAVDPPANAIGGCATSRGGSSSLLATLLVVGYGLVGRRRRAMRGRKAH